MNFIQSFIVVFHLPIFLVILVLILTHFLRSKHSYWKRKRVPQLQPKFFYGDQKKAWVGIYSKTELFLEIYKKFKSQNVKFGGFYMLWKHYFMPIDTEIIKDILKNSFDSFQDHGLYHHKKDMLFENVFTLEGQRWYELRKTFGPLFRLSNIKILFELLVEKYEKMDKILNEIYVREKRPVNINQLFEALVNSTYGLESDDFEYLYETGHSFGSYIFKPRKYWLILEQIIPWPILGYFGNKASNGRELEKRFQVTFDAYILRRDNGKATIENFMDLLINETKAINRSNTETYYKKNSNFKLTREDIVSHSFLFLASGFETSATSMTFVLLDLAFNLEIQDKLRRHVEEILEKHENRLTFEALHEMDFLEQVVKESLRHHPPFARIARICTKDYTIPNTDIVIKKGTKTIIPMWGIHMDEEYFPEPEKFNPDHFSKQNVMKRPECTWFPFGEGKRACLGQKLAIIQTKATVALLIKDYVFEINKRTKLPIEMTAFTIISKIKGDLWLNIHKV